MWLKSNGRTAFSIACGTTSSRDKKDQIPNLRTFIRPPTNFFSFPKSFSSFPVLKLHFSFFSFFFLSFFSISHSLWLSFISFHLITYVLLSPFVYYLYNCLSVCSISSLFPSHFPQSFSFILKTRLSFQIFQTPLIIHRLFTHCGWEFQFKEWMVKPKTIKNGENHFMEYIFPIIKIFFLINKYFYYFQLARRPLKSNKKVSFLIFLFKCERESCLKYLWWKR